jgi:peptide-methionine (S)-S-oxide reductase
MEVGDPILSDAIAAIESGDIATLDALLASHPHLLTDRIANGEEGYFAAPYLLWFVAGNPIRNARLPPNIVEVAVTIISHLDRLAPPSRQHQLDYTVMLAATGCVPREGGVQIALIDGLVAHGAQASGLETTVAHGEFDAARRLLYHGAPLTLAAAIGLEMYDDAKRLLPSADTAARADALVIAASLGLKAGVALLLDAGVDPNIRSMSLHRHATALHQAALTGDIALCDLLLARGASRTIHDEIWNGTPSGWADHAGHSALAQHLAAGR